MCGLSLPVTRNGNSVEEDYTYDSSEEAYYSYIEPPIINNLVDIDQNTIAKFYDKFFSISSALITGQNSSFFVNAGILAQCAILSRNVDHLLNKSNGDEMESTTNPCCAIINYTQSYHWSSYFSDCEPVNGKLHIITPKTPYSMSNDSISCGFVSLLSVIREGVPNYFALGSYVV